MKYLALIYADDNAGPKPGTPEFDKLLVDYGTASQTYASDGVLLGGEALQPVETATSIRIRNGKTELMDGPFAETKEQLGGFYLFECDTLDDAIKYAKMIPTAEYGTVEVRPIQTYDVD
ncbi:YciI family protein [Profundibacter amoris]|uniref:YciI family protein n=1 Tax=Profundibacter amoris TaxID=2171755 RepID=A0A347UHA5_9RHOB|nr:YciI family protein [Profundibacter amoris]AXX98233.1 YciI family protein [Profundibacter amoris]